MLTKFINALTELLKVKSLMTLTVAIGLVWGFMTGVISGEQFMTIVAMVFTFYFAKQQNQ